MKNFLYKKKVIKEIVGTKEEIKKEMCIKFQSKKV